MCEKNSGQTGQMCRLPAAGSTHSLLFTHVVTAFGTVCHNCMSHQQILPDDNDLRLQGCMNRDVCKMNAGQIY